MTNAVIRDEADLAVVQEQVQRLERIIQGQRKTILPQNAERYRLWSEQYIETLRELRALVDVALGLDLTKPAVEDTEVEAEVIRS